jgi:GNAT superfamily N-acetyltransferase
MTTLTAAPPIRLRFVSPFEARDHAAFDDLRRRAGGPATVPPMWDYLVGTLGAWTPEAVLVGYVQFGMGPGMTFEYGLRLDPAYRGQGLGRRLFAEWLRVARGCGARVALSCAVPGNVVMCTLLASASFEAHGTIPAIPEDEDLYFGGDAAFAWADAQPVEEWAWPS